MIEMAQNYKIVSTVYIRIVSLTHYIQRLGFLSFLLVLGHFPHK